MNSYPAKFAPDADGGFTVTFRDIPEAITQGDSLKDARDAARDALITAMDFYFEDRRVVPPPSKARKGEEAIELPVSLVAKVLLLNAMVEQRKRPADLARAMDVKPQEVQRLIDLHHSSKIDTLAHALNALGKRLEISVA